MPVDFLLRCSFCGREFTPDQAPYTCPHDGHNLDVVLDYDALRRPRLRETLGFPHLWVKDESPNPTASFKDRASAVVLARAREIRARVVV